jgi:pimeloyl-ACP methyl ester carboxylesterase
VGQHGLLPTVLLMTACAHPDDGGNTPHIDSLAQLTTESLRQREYGSTIKVEKVSQRESFDSYLASYDSDGLRVYTRIDIPDSPRPDGGYPAVIFVHGWSGIERAPTYDFYYHEHADYSEMIETYVDAGFVVLVPGWRGHGTVNDVPADGIDFMAAWDNGSYISPVFYAIDVLNLIDGLQSFDQHDLDLKQINLVAHSQGGDVALIALAVAGEGSKVKNDISAASIWSGTFPSRFTQLLTYWPMQTTTEAFFSGDGTWNSTAIGADGRVNEHFVFGYPSDWIVTVDTADWSWQKETWSIATVPEAVRVKLDQMYGAINEYVGDINDAEYTMAIGDAQMFAVSHDSRVADAMSLIGGFEQEQYLTEPLALQHSDRDFYSFPAWNADLCERVNKAGGTCHDFEYPENTHSLRVSENRWFSGETAVPGFSAAIRRDIALFQGDDPADIAFP